MLRHTSTTLLGLAARQAQTACLLESLGKSGVAGQQIRFIGGDKIPEFYAKPSPYTEGTAFLGTPTDHAELLKKRPLSPDVFELDGKHIHYKFPLGAITSITNRVTGVMLTAGFTAAGYIALTGDLPGALTHFRAHYPVLAAGAKLVVAWPIIYHWLGGVRHVVWDLYKYGNQTDHSDPLELRQVELSSKVLLGSSVVLALIAALL